MKQLMIKIALLEMHWFCFSFRAIARIWCIMRLNATKHLRRYLILSRCDTHLKHLKQ